ncbi:unnamed protein product [Caenorhabditis bovis]|uniref:CC domain-containing protein n=1 Tax=Caenorhabditis bovis TaxID=2654633 RepID=A0A8S1EFB3_9PELO|nr:unnamed protein product [Caenorhabditis bovis]
MNSILVFCLLVIAIAAQVDRHAIFEKAVGPCIADRCQSKHVCYYGQCVPEGIAPEMPRLKKEDSIGPCLNYMCPKDSFCHENNCYPL